MGECYAVKLLAIFAVLLVMLPKAIERIDVERRIANDAAIERENEKRVERMKEINTKEK